LTLVKCFDMCTYTSSVWTENELCCPCQGKQYLLHLHIGFATHRVLCAILQCSNGEIESRPTCSCHDNQLTLIIVTSPHIIPPIRGVQVTFVVCAIWNSVQQGCTRPSGRIKSTQSRVLAGWLNWLNQFASYLNALLVAFMRPQLVIWCEWCSSSICLFAVPLVTLYWFKWVDYLEICVTWSLLLLRGLLSGAPAARLHALLYLSAVSSFKSRSHPADRCMTFPQPNLLTSKAIISVFSVPVPSNTSSLALLLLLWRWMRHVRRNVSL
jgi:hypothetical protein